MNFPTLLSSGNALMCNELGTNGNGIGTCPYNAGDTVTFQWYHWPGSQFQNPSTLSGPKINTAVIDTSHYGPCSVYMAKGLDVNPGEAKWAKVWDLGYQNGKWCTQILNENSGKLSFKIPENLEAGDYLVRFSIIALHLVGNPEWYLRCAHLRINGPANGVKLTNLVGIPSNQFASLSMPGLSWNLYDGKDPNQYPLPGPPIGIENYNPTTNAQIAPQSVQETRTPVEQVTKPPTQKLEAQGRVTELRSRCLRKSPIAQ